MSTPKKEEMLNTPAESILPTINLSKMSSSSTNHTIKTEDSDIQVTDDVVDVNFEAFPVKIEPLDVKKECELTDVVIADAVFKAYPMKTELLVKSECDSQEVTNGTISSGVAAPEGQTGDKKLRKNFEFEVCDESFISYASNLPQHFQSIQEGKKYECKECNKIFNFNANYKNHILSVHSKIARSSANKAFNIGEKICVNKSKVENLHIKSVHKWIRYDCKFCEKSFSTAYGLRRHVKTIHEGKRYECEKCNKIYKHSSNYHEHIKSVHLRIKFQCSYCSKALINKRNLRLHVDSVHRKIKHHCDFCNKAFSHKYTLLRHVKVYHDGLKFHCQSCKKLFNQKIELDEHVRNAHYWHE